MTIDKMIDFFRVILIQYFGFSLISTIFLLGYFICELKLVCSYRKFFYLVGISSLIGLVIAKLTHGIIKSPLFIFAFIIYFSVIIGSLLGTIFMKRIFDSVKIIGKACLILFMFDIFFMMLADLITNKNFYIVSQTNPIHNAAMWSISTRSIFCIYIKIKSLNNKGKLNKIKLVFMDKFNYICKKI